MCHSKEENRNLAIKKLQQDIHNSPLHCFGQHQACSPDYCKIAKSKLTSENTTADPSSDSSLIPDDIQSDLDVDDTISNIIDNEITFWQDATNNENETEEMLSQPSVVDQQMLYDIQVCAQRLVGKAAHLIGKYKNKIMIVQ